MAVLLDLSNELLLQILDSVTPLAIVSFATSCKRINTLAQDDLALHRQRIAKYQNVTLWGCPRHKDKPHPILVLRDVCADWKVAYYARSLVIRCCGMKPYGWTRSRIDTTQRACIARDVEIIESVFPEIKDPVCKMLAKAFQWDEAKVNNTLEKTLDGVRGAILALLMVSLPAITSISFKDYVWSDELWIDSMNSITDQQDPRWGTSKANLLMDVSELNLDDQHRGPLIGMGCNIVPFLTLPSLRIIRGVHVYSASFARSPIADLHGHCSSPVTELYLDRSILDVDHLGELLRCMQALKRFKYDQGLHANDLYDSKTGQILNELLKHNSHSLESLAITSGFRGSDNGNLKASLKAFRVLRSIDIPATLLLPYREYLPGGGASGLETPPVKEVQRLVEVLPASVESVRVNGEMSWKEMAAMLIDLPEGKAEIFPKLKEILFMGVQDQGEQCAMVWKNLRQKQGMMLKLSKASRWAGGYSCWFVF